MDRQTNAVKQGQTRSGSDAAQAADDVRVAELVALERIGRELNSTFDMDQILHVLIHDVVNVTPATHASVLLFDREEAKLLPHTWYGYTQEQVDRFRTLSAHSQQGIVYRAFNTDCPIITGDVRSAPLAFVKRQQREGSETRQRTQSQSY